LEDDESSKQLQLSPPHFECKNLSEGGMVFALEEEKHVEVLIRNQIEALVLDEDNEEAPKEQTIEQRVV
jgi:hypothetical protein